MKKVIVSLTFITVGFIGTVSAQNANGTKISQKESTAVGDGPVRIKIAARSTAASDGPVRVKITARSTRSSNTASPDKISAPVSPATPAPAPANNRTTTPAQGGKN